MQKVEAQTKCDSWELFSLQLRWPTRCKRYAKTCNDMYRDF